MVLTPVENNLDQPNLFIQKIGLSFFRSYQQSQLSIQKPFIVLTGPNGAGKTNILEAISLLSPGRGLRGAKLSNYQNVHHQRENWVVSAHMQTHLGNIQIGTGRSNVKTPSGRDKRTIRIDGETQSSQSSLGEYTAILWLTPQMERLFLEGSSERRRFFDRFVFTFDPSHTGRLTRYNNALRQRSKILKEGNADPSWLKSLEQSMAETGVAIAAARNALAEKLSIALQKISSMPGNFPTATISLNGFIEEGLQNRPAIEVEKQFMHELEQSRSHDADMGGALIGPHKSDLNVVHTTNKMNADQCSTGEQKALLISLILAQSHLVKEERGFPPLLLLDDIMSHLDEKRRNDLFLCLDSLGSQCWITGTDRAFFDLPSDKTDFFEINQSEIHNARHTN